MYKSRLQELCHKRSWSVPVYTTIKDGPDHNPRFKATVTVNGGSFHTQNPCRSSKEAQNDAASVAFHHLTNPNPPPPQASIVSSFGHFPQPSLPSEPGKSLYKNCSFFVSVASIKFVICLFGCRVNEEIDYMIGFSILFLFYFFSMVLKPDSAQVFDFMMFMVSYSYTVSY